MTEPEPEDGLTWKPSPRGRGEGERAQPTTVDVPIDYFLSGTLPNAYGDGGTQVYVRAVRAHVGVYLLILGFVPWLLMRRFTGPLGIVWIPDHLVRRQRLFTQVPAIAFIATGLLTVASLAMLSLTALYLAGATLAVGLTVMIIANRTAIKAQVDKTDERWVTLRNVDAAAQAALQIRG